MKEYTENYPGWIAENELVRNISAGSAPARALGKAIHRNLFYIDRRTEKIGIGHQVLAGRPGTRWHKIYRTIIGIC